MAKQYVGFDVPMKAKDDMSSAQYYIVMVDGSTADQVDVCSAITDLPLGVLQTTGTTGAGVSVRILGHSKVKLGEVVAAGAQLGQDTSGLAIAIVAGTDTTAYSLGICTKGGNTNEIGEVVIKPVARAA